MVVRRAAAAVIVTLLSGTVGCGNGNGNGDTAPDDQSPTAPQPLELPDTPVGGQAGWVLDQLAADDGPPAQEVEERFAEVFLAEMAPEQFEGEVMAQLRPLGPWTATELTGDTHQADVALRTGTGDPWVMTIVLDTEERIQGLFFQPDPAADRSPAQSLDELAAELAGLAEQASFLAARVDGGDCEPLAELAAGDPLPLGSVAKLYVLGAVADAAGGGVVSWEDRVTVTDELRSLPTGELQDAPAGTEVTVQEAAEKMIEVSDNTATDLLIDLVGRDSVAVTQAAMGHADPDRNRPFLTTREMFLLGWSDGATDHRRQWADMDQDDRADMLAGLASAPLEVEPAAMTGPAWPDGVDWFASPQDVCAAHLALQQRAETPAGEPVRGILSANPGVEIDTATWPYVAFKGGSALGVLAGSWYAEHPDGSAVVVVFQLADPAPVDHRLGFAVAGDAFPLLAAELT